MSLPYENTTAGQKALNDIQKLLRDFGCNKFGVMNDDSDTTVRGVGGFGSTGTSSSSKGVQPS
jgi:hypothetical protein